MVCSGSPTLPRVCRSCSMSPRRLRSVQSPPSRCSRDAGVCSADMPWSFRLGDRDVDLTTRTLVMGILNRTPDSFYDHGMTFELDALFRRAEELVALGADLLDLGGVKAGPGPEVDEA